jgi:hypothetical protein
VAPHVIMPDAVGLLLPSLRSALPGATVAARVPNPLEPPLLVVRRTGGPRIDLVRDGAQITLEAYGASTASASDLIERARAHIHALTGSTLGGVAVYRATEFAGPGNFPDPLTDLARFTLTLQVALRGTSPA